MKAVSVLAVAALLAVVAMMSTARTPTRILGAGTSAAVAGHYLVMLRDVGPATAADVERRAGMLATRYGGRLGQVYHRSVRGFSVAMSEERARRLAADPYVSFVEQD